jgi:hypothetical protein
MGPSPIMAACFSMAARTRSGFCTYASRSFHVGAARNFSSTSSADFASAGTLPIFFGGATGPLSWVDGDWSVGEGGAGTAGAGASLTIGAMGAGLDSNVAAGVALGG